jgi:hypothetical protein
VTWQEPDHQRIEIFHRLSEEGTPAFVRLMRQSFHAGPRHDVAEIRQLERRRSGNRRSRNNRSGLGAQHRAFVPNSQGLKSLEVTRQVDLSRLRSRKELLTELDTLRRDVDASGEMRALDAFSGQALDMLTSGKVRRAFDLSDEKA